MSSPNRADPHHLSGPLHVTGRSRYDGGEWVSWNGIRISEKPREGEKEGK